MTSPVALPGRLAALGPIIQLAYVPTDFQASLDFWTRSMGVGPFFMWEHVAVDRLVYRGQEVRADFSVAIAYWGDIQIELIRQLDDAPTVYRDWRSDALHHVLVATEDYDAALGVCEREGFPSAMHGKGLLGAPDFRFAYCDLGRRGLAGYVEFADPRPRDASDRQAAMKAAARSWDGADPLRPMF